MHSRTHYASVFLFAVACGSGATSDQTEGLFDGTTKDGWSTSGEAKVELSLAEDETGNSALSVTGDEAQGSSVSIAIDPGDAAGTAGVTFRIRGSTNVRFSVTSAAVVPIDNGGSCDPAVNTCWDLHGADLSVTTSWQTITLDWSGLSQEGSGAPIGLDPSQITFLNWFPAGNGAFNIWIDDVAFYDDPMGSGSGGSTIGTGGSTMSSGGSDATGGSTVGSGGSTNPSEHRVGKYVDLGTFLNAFNGKDPKYTYQALLDAVDLFPDFAACCSETQKKREIAAFFAHVQHESDYLHATEEYTPPSLYCQMGMYPCAEGKSYHGRGALQLTWNYNYSFAQDYFASIGRVYSPSLVDVPEQVSQNEELLWTTALWFWMVGDPSYVNDTMHDRLEAQGFGSTIRKINGALECDGAGPQQVQQRVDYYLEWCERLGVDPGTDLHC